MTIQILRPHETVPLEVAAAIVHLTRTVWPPATDVAPPDVSRAIERWQAQLSAHFLIGEGEFWPMLACSRV